MRILCLHDTNSSAPHMLNQLKNLAEKLHTRHGIELAFVNSPLIVSSHDAALVSGDTSASDGGDGGDGGSRKVAMDRSTSSNDDSNNFKSKEEGGGDIKLLPLPTNRIWFHELPHQRQERQAKTNPNVHNQLIGLDASILSLRQIWNQCKYSNPFSGILGIGQGAALAALMPLLKSENPLLDDNCHRDCDNDSGIQNKWGRHTTVDDEELAMFEGIQICILIDGFDLLDSNTASSSKATPSTIDDYFYEETKDIPSLHIISTSKTDSQNDEAFNKSLQLFRHFSCWGGVDHEVATTTDEKKENGSQSSSSLAASTSNAQLHVLKNKKSAPSENATGQKTRTNLHISIFNIVGKFLVQQKKLQINATATNTSSEKQDAQTRENKTTVNAKNDETNATHSIHISDSSNQIKLMIEETRKELASLEKEAQSIITSTIAANPPKSLMAIITPDENKSTNGSNGTIVGGWAGYKDAFRSEGFRESGGAPCPKEFVLKTDER